MFNTLTPENLSEILGLELEKLQRRVVLNSQRLFTINVSPAAYAQLLKDGYDKKYNARHLKRTIEKYVAQPLASLLSTGQISHRDTVIVDYDSVGWSYYAQGSGEVLFP
jgi:ATP-dependent Clp protease ATP-binding subunit ClpA